MGEYERPDVPLSKRYPDPIWGPLGGLMSNAKQPTRRTVAVKVPEEVTQVEYLMLEAAQNVEDGKPKVAVTNLCHAVWKAHTTRDPISDIRLRSLMARVMRGGEFD